ncbi:MAG: GAF domain-containing protein [Gemmatimonadaceae bacterium]
MPPRTLASLAHALGAASDMEIALVSLGEALAEIDRAARIALLRYDARAQMIRDRLQPVGGTVQRGRVDTTLDHLRSPIREVVLRGSEFVDVGDESDEYARMLGVGGSGVGTATGPEEGLLALRGVIADGAMAAIVALHEPKRFFGTRVMERFGPYIALFELAYARFVEREARQEAVRTLEDVTQRVHGEYVKKLAALDQQLAHARETTSQGGPSVDAARLVTLEAEAAQAREEARKSKRRTDAVDQQVTAAVSQLEQAHVELHRRSEAVRQKTRTLYLLERVLGLDATTEDPRQLADGLLALVGDDMRAQRCSLMLRAGDSQHLFIAAAKGLAPDIADGTRITIGQGVAGKVASSRQPLLVTDVSQAGSHPLLRDEYFTTGSFISFPLIYNDKLVGVVNLTNRAQRGVFVEEDIERVRLLALVISLIASHAELSERLSGTVGVR